MEGFSDTNNLLKFKINEKDIIAIKKKSNMQIINNIVKYKVYKKSIKGVPIKAGDKLYTEIGVGNFKETKMYYVIDVDRRYVYVTDAYYLNISRQQYDNREVEINVEYILLDYKTIQNNNLEINDKVYFIINNQIKKGIIITKKYEKRMKEEEEEKRKIEELKREGTQYIKKYNKMTYKSDIPKKNIENMYIRLDNTKIKDRFNPQFSCYQDNTILNMTECIDVFDRTNKPKPIYNWDRPCKRNTECPFYLENRNYTNERGGCNNGYCELPIGYKRKSYREYDKNIKEDNYPRCYDAKNVCDINDEKKCCDKQRNSSKYNGPDYAFENDTEDRRLRKFY